MPLDAVPAEREGSALSADLSAPQRILLETTYQWLADNDRWPTYEELDHLADQCGVDEPLPMMRTLSPALLQGVGPAGPPSLSQELTLSLHGLAAVAGWNESAKEDLRWFAESVQAAVTASDRSAPSKPARFEGIGFLSSFFPHGIDAGLVIRLGLIWRAVGGSIWSGLNSAGSATWSAELNRQAIRIYRPVTDVRSLLDVEKRRVAKIFEERASLIAGPRDADRPKLAAPSPPANSTTSASSPAWIELLPDGFREAVATKIVEHPAEAITAGWIALADLIGSKVGLDLDGEDLVNQAFGKTPMIRLAPDTETGNNLHRGYTDLMRGLSRMRNAHSHRGRPPVTELHAAAVLMAMGECFRVVEQVHSLT